MTDENNIEQEQLPRKRRQKRDGGPEAGLNINSMMDMMVIILCFLLKSVGAEPIQINQNDDLRLPFSSSELAPEDMMVITITKTSLMVEDEVVLTYEDGAIDPSELQSADSPIIPRLQQEIAEQIDEQVEWANRTGREYGGVVTIVSDSQTPYRILTQVMVTAGGATGPSSEERITKFKFAILQRAQGSGIMQQG